MHDLVHLEPVDYLVLGHISVDLTPDGPRLGGTASYAAMTARALGLRPGIVTSLSSATDTQPLAGIPILSTPSEHSTTFENRTVAGIRTQLLQHRAGELAIEDVPAAWRQARIVHLGPIANEIASGITRYFSASLVGLTPQGWMRLWDEDGRVHASPWLDPDEDLHQAGAVVLSMEDVDGDLEAVERLAQKARVLCLTEAAAGSVVYWNGDRRRFRAPAVTEVDATGAGDIFAAAFFTRLLSTRDPWEAARFATHLAARSVTRPGLEGIPTSEEIEDCLVEVLS